MKILFIGFFLVPLFFSLVIIEIHAQETDQIRAEFCEKNWRQAPDMCPEFIPEGYYEEKASKAELTNEDRIKLDELEASVFGYVECPVGSHQKAVSGGKIICIDDTTRQQIEPIITNEIQLTDEQWAYVGIGIVIFIIIIAVIAKASQTSSQLESYKDEPLGIPWRAFSPQTKELVQERQHGRCVKCTRYPKHWTFHHIGRRDDNSPQNCKGLCLDCHEDITRSQKKDHHSKERF